MFKPLCYKLLDNIVGSVQLLFAVVQLKLVSRFMKFPGDSH